MFRKIIITTIASLLFFNLHAQELIGVTENVTIKRHLKNHPTTKYKSTAESESYITLPFFEDFNKFWKSPYPNPIFWADDNVFINHSFPDSVISIGVATLDAIDKNGNVYAVTDNPTPSDTLTSNFFNLSDRIDSTVAFSFFFQGGGKGEAPEEVDRLKLEFLGDSGWVTVWDTAGFQSHTFSQAILEIDSVYKIDSFQFRFSNLTSMSPNETIGREGALGNVDIWNIDYIQIKDVKDISEMRLINDVAFTELQYPSFIGYTTIPYSHLPLALGSIRSYVDTISFRTSFPQLDDPISVNRNHESFDRETNQLFESVDIGENSFPPNEYTKIDDYFNSFYRYEPAKTTARFAKKCYLTIYSPASALDQYKGNDTIILHEDFLDTYGYDDNTPEYGFGINGNGAYGAYIANRFQIYRKRNDKDTLTGVDIFFNKTRNFYTEDYPFRVCVWDDLDGKPNNQIYISSKDTFPSYDSNSFRYKRYPLEKDLMVSDIIYVGLIQESSEFINIGYDVSSDRRKDLFVNTRTGWYNPTSILPGCLMIRPVFGNLEPPTSIGSVKSEIQKLKVYPNPASNTVYFELPDDGFTKEINIQVINTLGQIVLQEKAYSQEINIEQLNTGLYIIRATNSATGESFVSKFIKSE